MRSVTQFSITALACLAVGWPISGITSVAAETSVELAREVRSILSENCYHCHGPDANTREADLRLDVGDALFEDRDGTTIIQPGSISESELFARITSDDPDLRMPPTESNLTLGRDEIETVRKWIESGAEWTGHWAYQPVVRPAIPLETLVPAGDYEGPRNALDWFVLAKLKEVGLAPSGPAGKQRLLRRVSLDLTGVPPTTGELERFLADNTPGAYDRAVDRLLSSPRYGERMVWEWLDAARYADSSGFQGDPERTMWPWRDWVVNALNANMPFDQFTIEQLAGDLLPGATQSQRVATGFNRNHMHNGEGGRIAEETRVENVFDRVETTATVWMGLTLTCARCHDHKYDPLTQKEYYELSAFFNNTSENGGGRGGQNAPAIEYRSERDAENIAVADQQIRDVASELRVLETEFLRQRLDDETIPKEIRDELMRAAQDRDAKSIDKLINYFDEKGGSADTVTIVAKLKSQKQARQRRDNLVNRLPKVMVMDEREKVRDTFVLVRGLYNKPSDKVATNFPAALPSWESRWSSSGDADRLSLAGWLMDPGHPLTSRVTVNRVWQSFFGRGLVASTENFGVQGEKPSHPKLLDWLASEFSETGWDMKRLHRLIVTSATYRQSSRVEPETTERDPKNEYLARGPRYRMPSWMLRDQALAIAGLLVDTMGGPSVKPYQPAGVWAEATFGKKKYQQSSGASLYRRSMYTFWRRIVGPPMFFDASKRQTCEVKNSLTNTPLHALSIMNDVTYIEAARSLAEHVMLTKNTPDDQIQFAFRKVTTRLPNEDEHKSLVDRLQDLKLEFRNHPSDAEDLLNVGESQRDETLSKPDHAAMTAVCLLLLNLDETLTKE